MVENNLDSWLKKYVTGGHELQKKEEIKKENTNRPQKNRSDFKHRKQQGPNTPMTHGVLRIVPLGGLSEVGKNMTVFEYGKEIIIVDCGLQFPEEDMFGIDYVIPDTSYLQDKVGRIKAIFITHGHLDHIGALPYLLMKLNNPPVYATKLTKGLIEKRLEEFGLLKGAKLRTIKPEEKIRVGEMNVGFFRVNHSIPDSVGITIGTPQGRVVHTGDFKFDAMPADGIPADMNKIIGFGSQDVTLLMSDSTNALIPGKTPSEKEVEESLDQIIGEAKGRIIIASFASLIGRIQTVLNSAKKHNRTVYVSGRSMVQNMEIAKQLGYLKYPETLVHSLQKHSKNIEHPGALILTTGSQGEAMSALTRIAMKDHQQIKIKKGDTVILSSKPIAGNERAILTVINNLCRLGAKVIDNQIMDVHTSGHGRKEDLKMMMTYVKPKFFIPIHGEYYMRQAHADLAAANGITSENILMPENGTVIHIKDGRVFETGEQAEDAYVMIDGLGMGHKGAEILLEREEMANNGVLVIVFKVNKKSRKLVDNPVVYSRGFLYSSESEEIIKKIQGAAYSFYKKITDKDSKARYDDIKNYIHINIDRLTQKLIDRRPLIVPIIISV